MQWELEDGTEIPKAASQRGDLNCCQNCLQDREDEKVQRPAKSDDAEDEDPRSREEDSGERKSQKPSSGSKRPRTGQDSDRQGWTDIDRERRVQSRRRRSSKGIATIVANPDIWLETVGQKRKDAKRTTTGRWQQQLKRRDAK